MGTSGAVLLNCSKEQGGVCPFPESSLPHQCVTCAALGTSVHKVMPFDLWKRKASAALTRSGLTCCWRLGVRAVALLAGYSCPWRYLLHHHARLSGALPLPNIKLKTQLHHYLFPTFSSIFLDRWLGLKSYKFPSASLPFLFWIYRIGSFQSRSGLQQLTYYLFEADVPTPFTRIFFFLWEKCVSRSPVLTCLDYIWGDFKGNSRELWTTQLKVNLSKSALCHSKQQKQESPKDIFLPLFHENKGGI